VHRPHQVVEERVDQSDRKLRHLPFFEFIASREESDPQWRTATAGLVVLRLVDAWSEDGPAVLSGDSWAVASVRAAIDDVGEGTPIKSLLQRVVDALGQRDVSMRLVTTPLMAFAQALEFDAHWTLAADVYDTVLGHIDPVEEADTAVTAHLFRARCLVNLGELNAGASALDIASDIATASGNIDGVLRARIFHGKIAKQRGNYPRAEEILDDTIRRAADAGMFDVQSKALHERSNVAHNRGNYELAIQVAYQALQQSSSSRERDRILGDIALSFVELGVYTAARDAYLVLSATAQEQYVRWSATLNLLDIAAQTGAETLFELYRRQLATEQLPPQMVAWYQLNTGIAYRRFGQFDRARTYLERALAIAEERGYHRYVFEAEDALQHLEMERPPRRMPEPLSLDTREVASAIQRLREVAGAT
jgi:tetratricopeptide (TPR) repeat protein